MSLATIYITNVVKVGSNGKQICFVRANYKFVLLKGEVSNTANDSRDVLGTVICQPNSVDGSTLAYLGVNLVYEVLV